MAERLALTGLLPATHAYRREFDSHLVAATELSEVTL